MGEYTEQIRENPRNWSITGISGNQFGVFCHLSRVSDEVSGKSHGETLWSSFSSGKRVHFPDSLLIPQN